MTDYITQTIAALNDRIAQYQRMIDFLTKLDADAPPAPAAPAEPGPRLCRRPAAATSEPPCAAVPAGIEPRSVGNLIKGRDLPSRFTYKEASALFSPRDPANILTRWIKLGFVVRTGPGQYKRTAAYPKLSANGLSGYIATAGKPARTASSEPAKGPQNILRAARSLKQPFGPTDLATAAGIGKSSAGGTITRWLARGWLEKASYGQYIRTASFGNPNAPAEPAGPAVTSERPPSPVKPAPDTRASLNQKLADACKQRDHARANGRDSMVEIFQADIDRLETQLDALK